MGDHWFDASDETNSQGVMSSVDAKTEADDIHIIFFPLMDIGHMLPMIDMAKVFANRGTKVTMVTTPHNIPLFSRIVDKSINQNRQVELKIIKFPANEANLPQGIENVDQITNQDVFYKFFRATDMLQESLEHVLLECRPNALVADMFFPWTTDLAAKYNIPRLVFYGTGFFPMCALGSLMKYRPYKNVSSDDEQFLLPMLPDEIKLTRSQLPPHIRLDYEDEFVRLLKRGKDSAMTSYGVIVNSFYELEPEYADHYKKDNKAWHIGPVSLCNRDIKDKARRGKEPSFNEHECLKWLDLRQPNSVVYLSFGSVARFPEGQIQAIAAGLEASGQDFIWVMTKNEDENGIECKLPEGFEERMKDKGVVIKGWAPQVLILDHKAIGGFVTHCGWNSILEGVTAGLPMVTWPMSGEQFFNEKLIINVLRIGVAVGTQRWVRLVGDSVNSDAVEKAVKRIMVGEEAKEMRSRAKVLGEKARMAVEEGGSSYKELNALIEDLKSYLS